MRLLRACRDHPSVNNVQSIEGSEKHYECYKPRDQGDDGRKNDGSAPKTFSTVVPLRGVIRVKRYDAPTRSVLELINVEGAEAPPGYECGRGRDGADDTGHY